MSTKADKDAKQKISDRAAALNIAIAEAENIGLTVTIKVWKGTELNSAAVDVTVSRPV